MDETLQDLSDDFAELLTLTLSAHKTLQEHIQILENSSAAYEVSTYEHLHAGAEALESNYAQLEHSLEDIVRARPQWQHSDIERLIDRKREYADLLRTLQGTLASVRTAGNWQSPSIESTKLPQAGTRAGNVEPNTNDYLRDYNLDEAEFAAQFAKEYIDHPLRFSPKVYFMSSCMAAFTTALVDIRSHIKDDSSVLIGKASYFQNKLAAERVFPGKLEYVDESNVEALVERARVLQPAAILLDTICGTDSLSLVDLKTLIPKLAKVLSRKTTLVLDNTGLATFCQPLTFLPHNPMGMQLVVVASLSKYYECGFDRVNAGVLWAPLGSAMDVGLSRMHLGTILPDTSLRALPVPDRKLFDARLLRIGRNAKILAQRLQEEIEKKPSSKLSHVVFPGLPNHASNVWAKDLPFQGGVMVIAFKEQYQTVAQCESFAEKILERAKEKGVNLIVGTGFGFNTTRLYYTTKYASTTMQPFVRLSAGTETRQEIELLSEVIASVIAEA